VILSRIKVLMKGRFLWIRTIGSTLAGELLDSLVFVSIASLAGVFRWELFASLVLTNYFLKCLIEILMTPVTYLAVRALKRKEHADTFDHGEKYNPFR
jgi:uncharacterized integral membrane protein (TIGR00697 family)